MIEAIIIMGLIITVLIAVVIYLFKSKKQTTADNKILEKKNENLKENIDHIMEYSEDQQKVEAVQNNNSVEDKTEDEKEEINNNLTDIFNNSEL